MKVSSRMNLLWFQIYWLGLKSCVIMCPHGPSHLVFSNSSQSHCDQEFQSQKTQDMSSGITVRRDHAPSHPAAGSSCPDPVYAAQSLYKRAPEPSSDCISFIPLPQCSHPISIDEIHRDSE